MGVDWNHRNPGIDDVRAAQQRLEDTQDAHAAERNSINSLYDKKLGMAQSEEQRAEVNDERENRLGASDEKYRQLEKNDTDNLQRMQDKVAANQNLTAVKNDDSPPRPPQSQSGATVGFGTEWSRPDQIPANDRSPHPGGESSPLGPANDNGPKQSASNDSVNRDFTIVPPPPPPPPAPPANDNNKDHDPPTR